LTKKFAKLAILYKMMKLNANLDVEIPFSTAPGADAGHFWFGFSLHLPGSRNGNEHDDEGWMKCKHDDSERDDSGSEPEDADDKGDRGNDAEHENVGGHSAANTVPTQGFGEHENVGHHLAANTA
jgi:hypothetical protein